MRKTNADRYHGGSFQEEVAALASLAMGVRFRAGNATRRFDPGCDTRGRPEAGGRRVAATLIREFHHRWRLPSAAEGSHSLDSLEILNRLPNLSPAAAVSLVRTARLYQDALWLIESEPSLAWLMLVSAVETAANRWQKTKGDPVDRMRESRPELTEYLEQIGKPEVLSEVARQIADALGTSKKFVDFIVRFLPVRPPVRPPTDFQFLWEEPEIRKALRQIYKYRSEALHDGRPFPQPMCGLPYKLDAEWEAWSEKPLGLASGSAIAVWVAKDVPMLFCFFEYIARQALLRWWREGAPQKD
jgi:hypothetical protein